MRKVIAFGAFDPLNEGQIDFLRQAKEVGDHLTVVVAHDGAIRAHKGREPEQSEEERLAAVEALDFVDEVTLGRKSADKYQIFGELEFNIVALGYNQKPSDEEVIAELEKRGKHHVEVVRVQPHEPMEHSVT